MAITRRDLRRDIARQMSDLLTLTATSGSNNMLVDPVELTDFDGSFQGSQAVCISSADPLNIGKVVRVLGSSQAGTSISFAPSLPASVAAGDVFDLVNLRNRGFRVQDYNDQIAAVIRKHSSSAPRLAESVPFIFDPEEPFIEIPAGWITIHGVVAHIGGQTFDVHAGRYDGARGWRVDMTGRRVEISGADRYDLEGLEVVLHGYTAHPEVTLDSDPIYLNPEFVGLTVQANLAQRRGDQHWSQWAAEWARMAAGVRPGKIPSWPANTIEVEES